MKSIEFGIQVLRPDGTPIVDLYPLFAESPDEIFDWLTVFSGQYSGPAREDWNGNDPGTWSPEHWNKTWFNNEVGDQFIAYRIRPPLTPKVEGPKVRKRK